MRVGAGDYELDDDPGRVDAEAAVAFLTTEAYWGRWRGAEDIERQVAEAWRVVGAYERAGAMVGFARAHGDGGCAYLSDVYVLPEHRGAGLGQAIVRMMIDDGPGAGWRWMLHTSDAHGLYRQFGFARPNGRYLERRPRSEGAASAQKAAAGTLAGKLVRLEPLQHQHVPGLVAAAAGGAELYAWSPVPQDQAQVRQYVETAIAAREDGTTVPFAVVRAADDTVIGSTRFFDLAWWPWPAAGPPRPRHLRDRLYLAQPERDQDRGEHRDEAPHAHARLRGLAGGLGVPAHRRAEPAVAAGHGTNRRAFRGRPSRPPARHGPAAPGLGALQRHRGRLAGGQGAPGGTGRPLRVMKPGFHHARTRGKPDFTALRLRRDWGG